MATVEERLANIESEISQMKMGTTKTTPKVPKVKRAPTAYNTFVKMHIGKIKDQCKENGEAFNHKLAFSSAAAAWKAEKSSS